jgi:hypothetical protein
MVTRARRPGVERRVDVVDPPCARRCREVLPPTPGLAECVKIRLGIDA